MVLGLRCLLDCHVLKEFVIYMGYWIVYTDPVKNCVRALPVCSLVNGKGIESTLYKAPRPSARVLTLSHAPTSRQSFLSPSGIEPAKDILCHNVSVALPTLCLSDDKVRLKFCESTVNMPYANGHLIRVENTKSSENSLTIALSCVYRTNISIMWLRKSPAYLINLSWKTTASVQ